MIWFGGKTTLYTVDLRDMSLFKIENMMADIQGSQPPEPLTCIADFNREKVLASFLFEQEHVLSYSEKGREADIHLLSELFPKMEDITCMDLDKNKAFGFIGGSTSKLESPMMGNAGYKKKAIVTAFTFNKSMKIVANIELPSDKCSQVGSILVSPNHDDLIYVNTDGPLFVLGLDVMDRKFHIVKAVNYHNRGKPQPI